MPEPITEREISAAFLFAYSKPARVRRTTEPAPWPWLGGAQHVADEHEDEADE